MKSPAIESEKQAIHETRRMWLFLALTGATKAAYPRCRAWLCHCALCEWYRRRAWYQWLGLNYYNCPLYCCADPASLWQQWDNAITAGKRWEARKLAWQIFRTVKLPKY
jgi:hypothetical protein